MPRFALLLTVLLSGCAIFSEPRPPLPDPGPVDLQRFMGDWYVIGFIPIGPESDAHNGIETYALTPEGRIQTTYRFREGGFDGELKTYTPNAKVVEGTGNAEWAMQFIWPLRSEYRIAYVDADYQTTIIARSKRDYVWLMAREPDMDDATFSAFQQQIAAMGYAAEDFVRQPQRWPEKEPRPPLD